MAAEQLSTRCCVVGGGPCGLMLGFLLARAGVDTVVLEKHGDFLRDFRGDTIHPSTLTVMAELGLLDDFLSCRTRKRRQSAHSSKGSNTRSRISAICRSAASSLRSCRSGIFSTS